MDGKVWMKRGERGGYSSSFKTNAGGCVFHFSFSVGQLVGASQAFGRWKTLGLALRPSPTISIKREGRQSIS